MTEGDPVWNPETPVRKGAKLLGSDQAYHLSECLLVEHAGEGYWCTCLDYSPER